MPRPIKVLHILYAFSHGGLENGIVNIINGSPPDIEHELCLLTTAGEFIQRLQKPVHYYELHKQPGNSLEIILQLRRVIRESHADIIHTRNWGSFDGVIAACICPGVKIIHGEHGRDLGDPQGLNRRRNLLRRLLSPRIRKFTTVSRDLADWLSRTVSIPERKVLLIPNGVDTDRYRPHRDHTLRQELAIHADDFVIGTIGRLDPVKNHAGLIRAYAMAAGKISRLRLVIVGDGPEGDRLRALITGLEGISPPILTGYRQDIERFYGLFDLFVLNSFAEGMSNTVLEAMASELPVICTPVGANIDLIADGERGRFVPVGDDDRLMQAFFDVLSSQQFYNRIALSARNFVQRRHSLSHMLSQYSALYRSL